MRPALVQAPEAQAARDLAGPPSSRTGSATTPTIGESYGTTRVAGLAGALQDRHWMFLNGVILVSPTGLGLEPDGPAPRSPVLKLPYYAAAARRTRTSASSSRRRPRPRARRPATGG